MKIAVCVSGGGTNLQAIIDKVNDNTIRNTEIAVVISNKEDAYALERARKVPGFVVSLADSQILTWINQLNGTMDYDIKAKKIKKEIKLLKKQPNSQDNKKNIREKYKELYSLQFKEDYVSLIIDKPTDYERANMGFKINGVSYKRLLCTTGRLS